MAETTHEFRRYAEVVAALADPALVPIPPTESAESGQAGAVPGTAAWLRGQVARFAHGPEHARRRAVVEAEVARLDPAALRKAATASTAAAGADPRVRTVLALAEVLGLANPESVAADVGLVSAVYFGGDDAAADAAVARLVEAYSGGPESATPEEIANRISILIQAYEATGSLVERAAPRLGDAVDAAAVEAVVVETSRHDSPVAAMRRVAVRGTHVAGVDIAEGDLVVLDIAAANRDPEVFDRPEEFEPGRPASPHALTFGSEPRRCPGRVQAVALATGILASARAGKDG